MNEFFEQGHILLHGSTLKERRHANLAPFREGGGKLHTHYQAKHRLETRSSDE